MSSGEPALRNLITAEAKRHSERHFAKHATENSFSGTFPSGILNWVSNGGFRKNFLATSERGAATVVLPTFLMMRRLTVHTNDKSTLNRFTTDRAMDLIEQGRFLTLNKINSLHLSQLKLIVKLQAKSHKLNQLRVVFYQTCFCLLYTSDAADE